MSPHGVLGLLSLTVVYGPVISQQLSIEKCIPKTQESCGDINGKFSEADFEQNYKDVCTLLYSLFECVAEHQPLCYDAVTENHKQYHATPYSCGLTMDQIIRLQSLVNRSKAAQAEASYKTSTDSNTSQAPPASIHIAGTPAGAADKGNASQLNRASRLLMMLLICLALAAS